MLHRASEKYFIRANFWPSERDSVFKASGTSPFFYHVPHDHNFSFLTVGYLGPGYWSEYYEYDYDKVVGLPGEKVDLQIRREGQARSGQGDALPRPSRRPQPAARRRHVGLDQHHGSLEPAALPQPVPVRREEVRDRRHPQPAASSEALLALAANHGGGNGRDLVESFAAAPSVRPHPASPRCASSPRREADVDAGLEVLARGARVRPTASSPAMSAREMARLEANRSWIEAFGLSASARRALGASSLFSLLDPAGHDPAHRRRIALRRSPPASPWRHRATPPRANRATAR